MSPNVTCPPGHLPHLLILPVSCRGSRCARPGVSLPQAKEGIGEAQEEEEVVVVRKEEIQAKEDKKTLR